MDGTKAAAPRAGWTWLAALVSVFMVAIDTLVVTTALPVIRVELGATLEGLEWTVNAYTLTFAVFLLSAAALGDRFGRRRVFGIALGVFTVASAAAALAPTIEVLVAARAVQGLGSAAILPLSLTLLASVVPHGKRGHAFGLWGAMVGLGAAVGPVIGGAVTEGMSWQWIFWVNVPTGVLLLPVMWLVRESRGGAGRLDPLGTLLVTVGLFGIVFGLVRGNGQGWGSGQVLAGLVGGGLLVLLFVAWQARAAAPMVPLRLFRSRGFSLTSIATVAMPLGVFGCVFLGTQYLQTVLGFSPLEAGVRTLPWTAMPLLAAPISGRLADRIGGRPLVVAGLALLAVGIFWIASIATPDLAYVNLVAPFVVTGIGLGVFLAPIAQLAIGFAPPELEGVASGTSNALRQLGTVLGVSAAGALFAEYGGYETGQAFVDGLVAAHYVAAAVLAAGALVALGIPARFTHRLPPSGAGAPPAAERLEVSAA
ncbi:MAG TPA: DHA2 family efflux MFS transporter permease subunit [Micromonosporaceae bacterium]|nr:DHA2 family efflux MFS transporter permease subunit [Micromonosporaceae bacterium]